MLTRLRLCASHSHLLFPRIAATNRRFASNCVFGIEGLQQPQDFHKLAAAAVEKSKNIRKNYLAAAVTKSNVKDYLKMLDTVSNELCVVIDTAELCRNIHSDSNFREAAGDAFTTIAAHIHTLNTDKFLYQQLCVITDEPQIWNSLSEEEQRFASDLKADFEKDGIHLPETEVAKSAELKARIDQLEALFWRHVIEENKIYKITGPVKNPRAVRSALKLYIPQSYVLNSITATTNKQLSQLFLQSVDDEVARQAIFANSFAEPAANTQVLEEVIELRTTYAKRSGFPSYAHQTLRGSIMQSPEDVLTLLEKLAEAVRPKAEEELETLKELKRADSTEPFMASDMLFYMTMAQHPNPSQTYFSMQSCFNGLAMICRELFDIHMQQEQLSLQESWAPAGTRGMFKFSFSHPEQGDLGTVLFDTYPRPGKFNHAAHFTLRCGSMYHALNASNQVVSPHYQSPVVALVTNFQGPPSDGDNVMAYNEVETLFHEFGHVLHSILSRTTFQHLSGTRGSTDFVEIPSHLMEYFARDPRVLKRFAKDAMTGAPISDAAIEALLRSRTQCSALDMQNQILFSMMDQMFFNGEVDKFPSFEEAVLYLQKKFTCVPIEHTSTGPLPVVSPRSFTHFMGYGGNYYSYIVAKIYAAHLWSQEFSENPLSRNAGDMIWHKLLVHGASKEPRVALHSLLGCEPDVNFLLSEMHHGIPTRR